MEGRSDEPHGQMGRETNFRSRGGWSEARGDSRTQIESEGCWQRFAVLRRKMKTETGAPRATLLNKELIVFGTRMRGSPNHIRIETEEMYLRWRVLNRMWWSTPKSRESLCEVRSRWRPPRATLSSIARTSLAIRRDRADMDKDGSTAYNLLWLMAARTMPKSDEKF